MEKVYSIEEIGEVAQKICEQLRHKVVLFRAPMGAGKTTFIQALLKEMGAEESSSSPTFSLVNTHELSNSQKCFHFDLYRLQSIEEALDVGIEEYLDSGYWCFIEWPEVVEDLLPLEYHIIELETIDETHRKIIMK